MDPMIIGQTLLKKVNVVTSYWGPWLPRQGDKATYAIELINGSGGDFVFRIETKNSEDPDSSAVQIGSDKAVGTSIGIVETTISGAKEFVRYVVRTANNANAGRIGFRTLSPQWAEN